MCSLDKRHELLKFCAVDSIFLVFLTETWLNTDIKDSEVFLGSSFKNTSRIDRERGQHGGLLIAQSCITSLKIIDFTIRRFDFAISCAGLCDKLSFFVLIYNPPASSDYSVVISYLLDCVQAYYTKFNLISDNLNYGPDYTVYFVGDFIFPPSIGQTTTLPRVLNVASLRW